MFSRKYRIDSVTGLLEKVQIKRQKKFEKELREYWQPIEKNLQNSGLARSDITFFLGFTTVISSLLNNKLTTLSFVAFVAYLSAAVIAPIFYTENAPKLPVLEFSKDNLGVLSEFLTFEQITEIKNILELFKIDYDVDLDSLKFILNKISEQIDNNNSTALFAVKPIDIKTIVSRYRPIGNEKHHVHS